MADYIGGIEVPSPVSSGLTFPLVSDFGYGMTRPWPIVVHRFGEIQEKAEQRFEVGYGPRKFPFKRQNISYADRATLFGFYESVQGSFQTFVYNAPQPNKSTTAYTVIFDAAPLVIAEKPNSSTVSCNFTECPSTATPGPWDNTVLSTCLRFPSSGLKSALLSQVQQIVPLVHIRVRQSSVPDIWLSDRRLTLTDGASGAIESAMGWGASSQLYLPRLLNIGEQGSDVILSQDIKGTADSVSFTFGNADRTMTALCNSTDLKYASVDLCLFHVQSQTILQLWKGYLISFVSDGTSNFKVQCSDGLYQLTQQYPIYQISRSCWWNFNDGVNCPYSTEGSGGNPNQCDYTYGADINGNPVAGANGCYQHGMTHYFGGHPGQIQYARIKDDSTGFLGFDRSHVTATSILSDTAWGQALPDIWCNNQGNLLNSFISNALIVSVRDEDTFFDALGVIGQGPLGSFAITGSSSGAIETNADGLPIFIAPLVDGFPAQGWKWNNNETAPSTNNALGLRQVPGYSNIGSGDQSYNVFGLTQIGGITGIPPYAPRTAFVELRYPKPAGLQPTAPESHYMSVPIAQGLTGWTWNATPSRTAVAGLTNPFWIAVNTLLRALGLQNASSATQLQYFVLSSLYVGDGTGTAEIADAVVDALVGTGTETQFQFQGVIGTLKPLRDWLTEILSCCLGFYTWEFGALKLGCRINATPVSAFTLGNILYQSLSLSPIEASFEHLIIDFADQAYQYQANSGDYQDKDHAAYYGRPGNPLTVRMHSVGLCTMSQTLRIAATRTREEIGGINSATDVYNNGKISNINPAQWASARMASWKTTILALETEVGQVVSLGGTGSDYMPDVPGGYGAFRIQKWTLYKDWSIGIEAKSVTASMYALDTGPQVTATLPSPLPVLAYAEPQGEWAPYQIQAASNDALFPNEYIFDLAQSYTVNADETALATISVTGKQPVNSFIPSCGAPVWASGGVTVSTTGGNLPGGITLRVEICATNGAYYSPNSPVLYIPIPSGTNTNQVTISDIIWPPFAGLTGFEVFYSQYDDLICAQQSGTLTAGGSANYTPTSITMDGPIARSTWGVPNDSIQKVRIKIAYLHHGGVLGAIVDSVGTNTILSSECIDSTGADNWTGRVIAFIARDSASGPFVSYNVTGFTPSTGEFVTSETIAGVDPDDVFVVCFKGYDNSATPLIFADSGISNATNGHAGMPSGEEEGYVLRVIKGTSRGMSANVLSNSTDSWIIDSPIVIDSTSVWIITEKGWPYTQDGPTTPVANAAMQATISLPTNNFLNQPILVAGFTVSTAGIESDEGSAPMRMGYIFGSEGSIAIAAGWAVLVITSNAVTADLSVAKNFELVLDQSARVTVDVPVWSGGSIVAGDEMSLYVFQDSTGERPTPAFASGTGGFGSDVQAAVLQGDPTTYSLYQLKFHNDNLWHLDSFSTGLAY